MSFELIVAFIVFAFTMSVTPGPNNMMLLSSGVNFGFRRSIPHLCGVALGFLALILGVGLGLGAFLTSYPWLYTALKVLGGSYLLYIAWKIGMSRSLSDGGSGASTPMRFWSAVAFQWVNPKAWVMAVGAIATYTDPNHYLVTVMIVSLIFAAVNVPCITLWMGFGTAMRGWLSDPVKLKYFNITMGVLLVLSLWPMIR
jgi:threonine/homoserine/homoserine lactone efflux protein